MEEIRLQTERLKLYPIGNEAMRDLIAREQDPEMLKAYGDMLRGCVEHPGARAWYAVWLMEVKDTGEIAGDLCFKGPAAEGIVEIGYGLRENFRGHGYMTEAVRALTDWALACPDVRFVEAETDPGNAASQRVLYRCGYIPAGKTGKEGPRFVYCPGIRVIDQELRLLPYEPKPETALRWYQDKELCMQVDGDPEPYTPERLEQMYSFLSTHGDCYYIEAGGTLAGDVTLRDNDEICIVICREYQNRHIGRRCVAEMLRLAREKGRGKVLANIYDFNAQSRRMFLAAGFRETEPEWFEREL